MKTGERIPLAEGYGSIGIVDDYIMMIPLPMPQMEFSPYCILDNEGNIVREGKVDGSISGRKNLNPGLKILTVPGKFGNVKIASGMELINLLR